ncbi:hypothetical protein PsorP6_006190 [Peronosclerospora sorghi]|uniref:Uncharacterized protein n=1 Tax=Peronosclerospora sorghi TaxID=230839 RepID=A0ACC0W455_9STRA|nr:hypothetical protein PsorP6_006190 [Peronosclerospora sorghi]
MYISVTKLDAQFLQHLSIDLVASYFGIPLEQDEEISPGIYMAKPGPLKPLANMIQNVRYPEFLFSSGKKILNECGKKLVELKLDDRVCSSSSFVATGNSNTTSPHASAVHLVNELIRTYPGFDDHNEFHGEKVNLFKRKTRRSLHLSPIQGVYCRRYGTRRTALIA